MARHWQLLLLTGALLAPTGAWDDKKDGDKQRGEHSERGGRVWDDNDRGRNRAGRVWDAVNGRDYPRNSESEKEWRKDRKERDKDRRKALKEREKDRREAAREYDKDRRETQRESDKDRREARRDDRRDGDYRSGDYGRYPRPTTRLPYPIP